MRGSASEGNMAAGGLVQPHAAASRVRDLSEILRPAPEFQISV